MILENTEGSISLTRVNIGLRSVTSLAFLFENIVEVILLNFDLKIPKS